MHISHTVLKIAVQYFKPVRKALLFTFLLFYSCFAHSQRAGYLDLSFNYGQGSNYQFNYVTGSDDNVPKTSLLSNKSLKKGNITDKATNARFAGADIVVTKNNGKVEIRSISGSMKKTI